MIEAIVEKFIDDPESLTEEELETLSKALSEDAELARTVNAHLRMAGMLSLSMHSSRQAFPAQVQVRIDALQDGNGFVQGVLANTVGDTPEPDKANGAKGKATARRKSSSRHIARAARRSRGTGSNKTHASSGRSVLLASAIMGILFVFLYGIFGQSPQPGRTGPESREAHRGRQDDGSVIPRSPKGKATTIEILPGPDVGIDDGKEAPAPREAQQPEPRVEPDVNVEKDEPVEPGQDGDANPLAPDPDARVPEQPEPSRPEPAPKAPTRPDPPVEKSRPTVVASIERLQGTVSVYSPEKDREAAREGRKLTSEDEIRAAGAGNSVVIAYADGTRIECLDGTIGDLADVVRPTGGEPPKGGKRVKLSAGRLNAQVVAQPDGCPMVVSTPDWRVQVVGTRFSVSMEKETFRVHVAEGAVRVTRNRDGRSVQVKAGQCLVATLRSPLRTKPFRIQNGLVARFLFLEGKGAAIKDVSGVGGPLHLQVQDPNAVRWLEGGGLEIQKPTVLTSGGPAQKIIDASRITNAISIEAWVRSRTAKIKSGFRPARIVSVSGDSYNRNFTLGQGVQRGSSTVFDVRLKTTKTNDNGVNSTTTVADAAVPEITHVVYTRDPTGKAMIYVNGTPQEIRQSGYRGPTGPAQHAQTIAGSLSSWNTQYALLLGNEAPKAGVSAEDGRPWLGEFHLVAIFNRAISMQEVQQSYRTGLAGRLTPR